MCGAAAAPCAGLQCRLPCRKGGQAATTDANLVLGRILPEFFPAIFGESEDQPLDQGAAEAALEALAERVNQQADADGRKHMSRDEVCSWSTAAAGTCCRCMQGCRGPPWS